MPDFGSLSNPSLWRSRWHKLARDPNVHLIFPRGENQLSRLLQRGDFRSNTLVETLKKIGANLVKKRKYLVLRHTPQGYILFLEVDYYWRDSR